MYSRSSEHGAQSTIPPDSHPEIRRPLLLFFSICVKNFEENLQNSGQIDKTDGLEILMIFAPRVHCTL